MNAVLDRDFVPAAQWHRAYEAEARAARPAARSVTLGLLRDHQPVARRVYPVLPADEVMRTFFHIERRLKSLLWAYGGHRILVDGPADLLQRLQKHYASSPTGRFDSLMIGERIFGTPLTLEATTADTIPEPASDSRPIGRHLDGCRIGFDLGGSDRKCAAMIDGTVVFSEEVPWNPYFQKDPQYHFDGIMDSLQRAAAHLPRVDAIGGSAAGVYVKNEVRVSSLFRGVNQADFDQHVRGIFHRVRDAWNHVPFIVINDGDVAALAGAMSLNVNALLGVSMGTSMAAGYVTPEGFLTSWLNELAFVPVDYRPDAPADEWSGDLGCAVQFFSQQGVARLACEAGLDFDDNTPLPDRLLAVQDRMEKGDLAAERIYTAIGDAFGHTLAHWTKLYTLRHVLILGRVTSGAGGDLIVARARRRLEIDYPDLAEQIQLHMPNERMKRHGQAVAAASLPALS